MNQNDKLDTYALASAATNYTSSSFHLNGVKELSIHVKFSDVASAGTLALEGSNDPLAITELATTADWVPVIDSQQVVAAGVSHMWNITGAMYKCIRFTWVRTGGAGNLTAWMDTKFLQG